MCVNTSELRHMQSMTKYSINCIRSSSIHRNSMGMPRIVFRSEFVRFRTLFTFYLLHALRTWTQNNTCTGNYVYRNPILGGPHKTICNNFS